MSRLPRIAALALLAAALLVAPTHAQDVLVGATPGGAFYTIAVPDQWNGGLVIYNHGFSLTPGAPGPDLGPLQALQLVEGYAVAASSYQQVGWAVFKTNQDLEQLVDVFQQEVGQPSHVLLFGVSLGGIVTARAIEQANLGNVVGALTICGAMAGSRNWDLGLDGRLGYDAICGDVPGAAIPGGPNGLALGSDLDIDDVVLAMNVCFGHDLPPSARTGAQQARLDQFLEFSQIPQSFINRSLGFFTVFAMADLVYDPDKLGGGNGIGNANVDYGDPVINANIERFTPTAARRRRLRRNYTPTGNVGNVKIVSIHTDQDGLVIVENESEYASVVPPGNLTVGVVQEATPTHCGFTQTETIAAWETLRAWVAGDPQPSALTLQVMCKAIEPTFGGPCRFNPFFQIPDMDGRARPRNAGVEVRAPRTVKASVAGSAPPAAAKAPAAKPSAAPQPAAPAPSAAPQEAPQRAGQPQIARSPRRAQPADELEEAPAAARRLRRLERQER